MSEGMTKKILKYLGFLIEEYNFKFSFQSFDMWKYFYGPMDTYSFYNEFGCLTLHNAVQRGEWGVFVSKQFSSNQYALMDKEVYLANYTSKSCWTTTGWLKVVSKIIKAQIESENSVFDIPVKLSER